MSSICQVCGLEYFPQQGYQDMEQKNGSAAEGNEQGKCGKAGAALFVRMVQEGKTQHHEKIPECRGRTLAQNLGNGIPGIRHGFAGIISDFPKNKIRKLINVQKCQEIDNCPYGSVEPVRRQEGKKETVAFQKTGQVDGRDNAQAVDQDGERAGEQEAAQDPEKTFYDAGKFL